MKNLLERLYPIKSLSESELSRNEKEIMRKLLDKGFVEKKSFKDSIGGSNQEVVFSRPDIFLLTIEGRRFFEEFNKSTNTD